MRAMNAMEMRQASDILPGRASGRTDAPGVGRTLVPALSSAWAVTRDLSVLFRLPVSLMVGVSTAFGALLARPRLDGPWPEAALAAMLLAWGCSAWNQTQERRADALMERTARRPLAAGRMPVPAGVMLGAGCVLAACAMLHALGGVSLAGLGLGIALVYNGIYTPLKKRTAFALLAGAAVGATPPLVGWLASGGGPGDPLLPLLYGVYALWQIPHFWLRAGKRTGEYRRAGFVLPVFAGSAGTRGRLLEIWFCAFASALLMLPALPLFQSLFFRLAATAAGLLALCGAGVVFRLREGYGTEKATGPAIALADGSLMLFMLLLVADALLAPVSA